MENYNYNKTPINISKELKSIIITGEILNYIKDNKNKYFKN